MVKGPVGFADTNSRFIFVFLLLIFVTTPSDRIKTSSFIKIFMNLFFTTTSLTNSLFLNFSAISSALPDLKAALVVQSPFSACSGSVILASCKPDILRISFFSSSLSINPLYINYAKISYMPPLLENKKAYFNYEILETYEAGLSLLGIEVKSLKSKNGNISGARVLVRGEEAYIVGIDIPPYQPNNTPKSYDRERTRKILLHKKEISHIGGKADEKGLTIVPLKVYTSGGRVKIQIAVVRGKKKFEKRDKIKKRDIEREIGRSIRG